MENSSKMKSLKVGHYTDKQHQTGLTVFLFDKPVRAAYHLCGSSPASREVNVLELEGHVNDIHGLLLTGGSALGLGATDGVMRFLKEKGIGLHFRGALVPIVPTAAIFDLAIGSSIPPSADDAYKACVGAKENEMTHGQIGAGTGASVGKIIPDARWMSGGLGVAELSLANGLTVTAYAVVNALGDIYNNKGEIIAGARLADGQFAGCDQYDLFGEEKELPENTVLVALFTNGFFTRVQLKRIAKMAVSGISRAVNPAFTPYDGDIIFCVSLGDIKSSELTVGVMAAEVIRQAITNAVLESKII